MNPFYPAEALAGCGVNVFCFFCADDVELRHLRRCLVPCAWGNDPQWLAGSWSRPSIPSVSHQQENKSFKFWSAVISAPFAIGSWAVIHDPSLFFLLFPCWKKQGNHIYICINTCWKNYLATVNYFAFILRWCFHMFSSSRWIQMIISKRARPFQRLTAKRRLTISGRATQNLLPNYHWLPTSNTLFPN